MAFCLAPSGASNLGRMGMLELCSRVALAHVCIFGLIRDVTTFRVAFIGGATWLTDRRRSFGSDAGIIDGWAAWGSRALVAADRSSLAGQYIRSRLHVCRMFCSDPVEVLRSRAYDGCVVYIL